MINLIVTLPFKKSYLYNAISKFIAFIPTPHNIKEEGVPLIDPPSSLLK